jgi:DNA-binding transcriptional ArsR family regulator
MATSNRIAEVASAVGEPARAAMLAALMDGRALTATELAEVAAITPQTASGHLAKLASVGLIAATDKAATAITASPAPRLRG